MDLSHWDFAEQFKANEAAALILGLPPESASDIHAISEGQEGFLLKMTPVLRRMNEAFKRAVWQLHLATKGGLDGYKRYPGMAFHLHSEHIFGLRSLRASSLRNKAYVGHSDFSGAFFSRKEIQRWLDALGMTSVYQFDQNGSGGITAAKEALDIDPTDLPEELDAANVAYRVVSHRFDIKTGTFRNKVKDYVKNNYPHLKHDAVERIATVANPDKTRGRKTREAD